MCQPFDSARSHALFRIRNRMRPAKLPIVDHVEGMQYRVLEFGDFLPILGAHIVDTSIAEVFRKYVPEQIESVEPIAIWRKSTGETWNNYSRVIVCSNLDLESLPHAASDGMRIYVLQYEQIYVSAALKEKLFSEVGIIDELEFDNDWPLYAG